MRITRDADSEWIAEFDLQYLVYLPNQYFEWIVNVNQSDRATNID